LGRRIIDGLIKRRHLRLESALLIPFVEVSPNRITKGRSKSHPHESADQLPGFSAHCPPDEVAGNTSASRAHHCAGLLVRRYAPGERDDDQKQR
jgi:hypothetical protein